MKKPELKEVKAPQVTTELPQAITCSLTRNDLVNPNLKAAFKGLTKCAITGKTYYMLNKLGQALADESNKTMEKAHAIFEKHCEKDEKGEMVLVEGQPKVVDQEAYKNEVAELSKEVVDLGVTKFPFHEFMDCKLTSEQWEMLQFMFFKVQ